MRSGASERANADCQELFEYLWGADSNLSVSTGRGASAAADWAANKTIALPDWRGRALAFLDDMGNSAAGRLTATYFGATATTLGAAGGSESRALVTNNLPTYTPAGTIVSSFVGVYRNYTATAAGGGELYFVNAASGSGAGSTGTTVTSTFTGTPAGNSTPVAVMSPAMLATIYLKL